MSVNVVVLVIAITVAMAAGYIAGQRAKPPRVRLSPPTPPEGVGPLRLFVAGAAFTSETFMVIDREGRWTTEMVDDFADNEDVKPGLRIWEGFASGGPDGCRFVGAWRSPTAEEVGRLTAGKFPLRGAPLPLTEASIDFEETGVAK